MMLTRVFITTLLLGIGLSVGAAPVSLEQARQKARDFMGKRQMALSEKKPFKAPRLAAAGKEEAPYYVFNAREDKGYVIISGDDRTPAVLGYVDQGIFDADNIPDGLKWMLQTYTEQMELLDGVFEAHASRRAADADSPKLYSQSARHNVAPLLPMLWNQGEPYNLLCPRYYNEDGTQGGLSATGCVATAMAQVVGYYRWPAKLKRTIPGYVQKYNTSQGEKSVRISNIPSGSVIDWDNILNTYNGSETEAQKTAIAQLMYWVGVDCKMNYGAASSSGYSEGVDGLISYFDFDDGTHVEKRDNYTLQGWNELIYNEIATGHPVPFGGQNSGGGHAFVLDGYDVDGLYHVNWGWGGMANGYFRIDILDPDNTSGIGASQTPGGYNMGQDCIIGMRRPDGITDNPPSRYKLSVNDWELRGTNKFFANFVNWSGVAATWNMGIAYVNEEGGLTIIGSYTTDQISQNYYVGREFTVRGLAKGVYKVVPVSKRSTDKVWLTNGCPEREYVYTEIGDDGQVVKMELRPNDHIEMTELSFPGNHKLGDNQTVSATFRNVGEDEFFREIHLLASQTSDKGSAICRTAIDMTPGEEKTIALNFKPEQTGTWNIWLSTDNAGNNIVGQGTLEITEQGLTANHNLRYVSHSINNISNGIIYGNRMQGKVTIMNQSDETYDGQIRLWLFKLADNGYFYGANSVYLPACIEPGSTQQLSFDFDNLDLGATYNMSIIYGEGGDINDGGLKSMGKTQRGILYWQQNQNLRGMALASSVTIPGDAVAVDLSMSGGAVKTVKPNGNPNTIYYTDQALEGLENANQVIGRKAEKLNLKDGYSFLSPYAFTVQEASYERQPATGKWETITLPFNVETLPSHTIVKGFSQELNGQAVFAVAHQMEVGVPYVVYSTSEEPLLFSASRVSVSPTLNSQIVSATDNYRFSGTTVKSRQTGVMVINDEGTAFVPASTSTVQVNAFRGWFTAPGGTEKIEIGMDDVTRLNEKVAMRNVKCVYDLQGRKVNTQLLSPGIYIINGKKVIQ